MAELKTLGRELSRALDQVNRSIASYYDAALAEGRAAGDPTARGLDGKQLRRKLQCYVVARLSPKTGLSKPLLTFDGAPEARRYCQAHPLPGVSP